MSSEYIVAPAQIENQLLTIWDSLQGTGKTRACLFNLIIYTQNNKRVDYMYTVARKVISKFPSRVIFVTINDKAPAGTLKTAVSVITSESENNATACDLINIMLSADNRERAPFLILPQIITDLPIYLLWADDPSKSDPVSQKLEKLATRVIFDSESADNLGSFAEAILKHKDSSGSDIADLNWARTEGWRQLLAETFKSKERLSTLSKLSTLTISYNCLETDFFCHTKIQALYLQGWLASQMNWTLSKASKKDQDTVLEYDNKGAKILVRLSPKRLEGSVPGRVLEVQLAAEEEQLFHFSRSSEAPHMIHIKYSNKNLCQLPTQFVFDRYESGQSLVKEIFHKGTSHHYLTLIRTLSKAPREVFS